MARPREKGPWFWRSAIGVMLLSVVGLFSVAAFNAAPALDPETECRMDRNDPAHTVLLIDQSDPFSENDLAWVDELIDAEARALPRFGRLTVILPNSAQPFDPKTLYVHCSPGSVEDANPILQNPRMIDDTWREHFYKPLSATVGDTLKTTSQPSSPLFEALYAVGDRADFQTNRKNRRLVIVSDLMQHSDGFSFYRNGADLAAYGNASIASQTPRFDGVDVVARIVPRQEYDLPISELKAFWRSYFDQTGATFGSTN
ncbi:MAG: hypothetical protein AAF996_13700 [Pseudomonadota bacterium]